MSARFVDPYINPETGILRNLVEAKTYDELANAEGELVVARVNQLLSGEIPRLTGSLDDLRMIHATLFQDVFDWAGAIRTVEIRKNVVGSEYFLSSIDIERGAAWAQSELKSDDMLVGMTQRHLAQRLAYHYDNYNFIHPFREGNGRTQRLFWSLICRQAGYDLDWCRVSGAENDEASRAAAEDADCSGLIAMFERIAHRCDPVNLSPGSHVGGDHLS